MPALRLFLVDLSWSLRVCKINVKENRLVFDVGEHHAEFGLFKDHEPNLSSFSCFEVDVISLDKLVEFIDLSPNYPQCFACESFDDQGFDQVKVDLVEHITPSIVKDVPYTFDEGSLSYCYKFVTLMLPMPPLCGGVYVDMEFKFGFYEGGLSNGACLKMIAYMDHTL